MTAQSYTCAICHRDLVSPRSDEEARAEAERVFGPIAKEDEAVICDDCHKAFKAWFDQLTPAEHAAIRAEEQAGWRP